MTYTRIFSCLAALFVLGITACKKDCEEPTDPSCRNYDPCFGQTPLTADFHIKEELRGSFIKTPYSDSLNPFIVISNDTVLARNRIQFVALDDADRYEWQVGSDPRTFEGKEFALTFWSLGPYFNPETLPVKLTVYRDEPQSCYPLDTQAVSARNMTLLPDSDTRLVGLYEGTSTRWPDSLLQVRIFWQDRYGSPTVSMYGLPKDCEFRNPYTDSLGFTVSRGYKTGIIEEDNSGAISCFGMQFVFRLSEDNQQINIQYFLSNGQVPGDPDVDINEEFLFTGRRIE